MKYQILTLTAGALMLASCANPIADNSGQRHLPPHDQDRYKNTNLDNPPTGGTGQYLNGPDNSASTKTEEKPNIPAIDDPKPTEPAAPTNPPANPEPTSKPAPETPPPAAANIPYGKPVPGKKGFVTSPYDPAAGMIDVRDIPPGTKVKDPYTQKVFLVP